jgi:hypothetical protein
MSSLARNLFISFFVSVIIFSIALSIYYFLEPKNVPQSTKQTIVSKETTTIISHGISLPQRKDEINDHEYSWLSYIAEDRPALQERIKQVMVKGYITNDEYIVLLEFCNSLSADKNQQEKKDFIKKYGGR